MERATARGTRDWMAPLTGILFLVLLIAAAVTAGDLPDATEKSAREVLETYRDDEAKISVGALLFGLASVALLFFAGWLRRFLRDAEGPTGILSAVSFAGAIILAVGLATSAAFAFATADVADDITDPTVVQSLNALSWGYWIPFAAGVITMFLAAGISVIRHGALPKWLGWVAIVAGVLMFTPAFFVAGPVAALWILVVSIFSARRARAASTGGAAA